MSDIKIIHGDSFESSGVPQYIAKDNAVQINISQQAPVEELLALLDKAKQELSNLPVAQEVKEDVEHEVNGALRLARRNPADRKRIADSLDLLHKSKSREKLQCEPISKKERSKITEHSSSKKA